jgi:hypothetical protein
LSGTVQPCQMRPIMAVILSAATDTSCLHVGVKV